MYVSIFVNSFQKVPNLVMMKKIKGAEEGPMYTHNNFCTSASVRARTTAINMKGASVLDLISQATYI